MEVGGGRNDVGHNKNIVLGGRGALIGLDP